MKDSITQEDREAISKWLETNKITKCNPGERTSSDNIAYTHGWGKKKKKKGTPKESK